jgi:uncharacterized protein YoaH (UPF0181 family)
MPENPIDRIPTTDQLGKMHESKSFPGSNDVSMTRSVDTTWGGAVSLSVRRPSEEEMYSVFLNEKGIAMIGGSTSEAEGAVDRIQEVIASAASQEEAVQAVRTFIVDLHGGLAK